MVLITVLKRYSALDLYVFQQIFPTTLTGTSFGNSEMPMSCFPTVDASAQRINSLGYLTQHHIFGGVVNGLQGLAGYNGGVQSGTPLVLYDPSLIDQNVAEAVPPTAAIVFSPLESFKVASPAVSPSGPCSGGWAIGLNGMVNEIPANYTFSTLLTSGASIHDALQRWGQTLRTVGGKDITARANVEDITANSLSYWTDNGVSLELWEL